MSPSQRFPWSRRDHLILLTLALIPYVIFYRALRFDTLIVGGDGIVDLPYRILTARRALAGEWPFWAPEILGGTDLWSYPVSAVLHPLTYLFGILPPFLFLNIFTVGVYSLSLVGMYIFARKWGLDRAGSSAAAISYAFCGFFLSYYSLAVHGMGHAAAFVPLLLAAFKHLAEKPGPRRASLAALATFGMGMIGQQQIFLYGFVQVAYVILITLASLDAGHRRKSLLWAIIGMSLGGAALGMVYIPTFEWAQNSDRSNIVNSLSVLTRTEPPWKIWQTLFWPHAVTNRLQNTYFGLIPTFLALLGAATISRDRKTAWALGGCALALIGLYWSSVIPFKYISNIPILRWFHSPSRHMFELFLWMAILAGTGMTSIFSRNDLVTRKILVAAAVWGLCIVATTRDLLSNPLEWIIQQFHQINICLAILAAVIAIIGLVAGLRLKSRPVVAVVILAMMILLSGRHYNKVIVNSQRRNGSFIYGNTSPFLSRLQGDKTSVPKSFTPDRAVYLGFFYPLTLKRMVENPTPNYGMSAGFPFIQAKNELLPKRYVQFLGENNRVGIFASSAVMERHRAALDLLNTRYAIVQKDSASVSRQKWSYLHKRLTSFVDTPKLVALFAGNNLTFSWREKRSGLKLIILSAYSDTAPPGSQALKIEIRDSRQLILTDVVLTHATTQKQDGENDSRRKYFIAFSNMFGKIALVELEYPLPDGTGPFSFTITALLPKGPVIMQEAALVDSDDNIVKRFPLIEQYMESILQCRQIFSDENVVAFERPGAFPRQWLTSKIAVVPPERVLFELSKASAKPDLIPRLKEIALVEDQTLKETMRLLASTAPDNNARIERTVDRPNYLAARTTSTAPTFAVFSEAWAKGWKAKLDGKPVPIYVTDYYLRGIFVPAGNHIIEMRYLPQGFIPGLIITIVSMILMIILALWKESGDTPIRRTDV